MIKKKASMADFESLLNAQLATYRSGFNPGDRVRGTVTNITGAYVILDVSAKREGLVPTSDMTLADGTLRCTIGDAVDVIFAGMQDGAFLFAGSIASKPPVDRTLADAYAQQMPIEGLVEKEINGGYEVKAAGRRAFCPFSQISLFRQEGAEYIGQKFLFLVSEYGEDERGENVILSRRALLEKEREAQRQELVDDLSVGMVATGVVTRMVEFGVFVDLGGVEGLIPLKEIAWSRDVKPEDVVKVGDRVDVQIKDIDWERDRISLSLRGAQGDPWDDAVAAFPQGATFVGKITKLERFGAFAQLVPGVEGLIPISKLGGGRRIMSAREVVSEGQEILLKVESVDLEKRRFSLSPVDERVKALTPGELAEGVRAEGIVESVQAFGVFVRLSEEKTGLLHISETDTPKGGNPAAKLEKQFPPASKIEVVVKSVEGDRIALTLPAKWEARGSGEGEGDDLSAWLADSKGAPPSGFGSLGDVFSKINL
ncbi:MAG: S1 RNA-binding domain-containing protein [Kiritimatiellaeota bacterium]|nr:S1 RNA-binding domain-containing protein [Kiritimatiellota bacterium]